VRRTATLARYLEVGDVDAALADLRSTRRGPSGPHWLFHFGVDSLDRAIDAVRAGGGYVVGPIALPNGERVAVCDDSQGAAFAMRAYSKF
jgi:predicted enzyme related to lactoylglutathione lyase